MKIFRGFASVMKSLKLLKIKKIRNKIMKRNKKKLKLSRN